ncbi:MAG: hypothetical protein JWQ89_751 [Devosia sp.]|uniref:hypothetical protein n=1 Tax=Devosia sp. TaxID=1871048 RepID=UPI00261E6217|nr:hypothetical protein [Devosia sp.]MDB5539024.1 hypothetical protein [Devosia sp.]
MELNRADGTLTLVHAPEPPNKPALIALCIGLYIAVVVTGQQLSGDSTVLLIGAGLLCLGAIGWLVLLRPVIDVTTTFDLQNGELRVVTRRQRSPDKVVDITFSDVSELRLLEQRSGGTVLLTLTMPLRDGRTMQLGNQRFTAAQQSEVHELREMVLVIRETTGIGGPEPLPGAMAAAAASVGMRRS